MKSAANTAATCKADRSVIYRSVSGAQRAVARGASALFRGDAVELTQALPTGSVDLIVTSPPYCIGMPYETSRSVDDFIRLHELLLPECARVLRPGGSLCWQVGYHTTRLGIEPLDFHVHAIMRGIAEFQLRNRIVWAFGHGTHASRRFSGRHETIMWYSKGREYQFDLDPVRIPQKYPGKKHYKGPKKGEYSGNPLGKNPGDVWEIPNVKSKHVEKTTHPCQFPVGLVQRLVRCLTVPDALVFDPFAGSGSSGVAAVLEGRRFLGADVDSDYVDIAAGRIALAAKGQARFRPFDQPIHTPERGDPIQIPDHFKLSFELA